MRRATLPSPTVVGALTNNWVATWHDRGNLTLDGPAVVESTGDQSRSLYGPMPDNGYGAGQVACFMTLPDGRLVHYLDGFVRPALLKQELDWASRLVLMVRNQGTKAAFACLAARLGDSTLDVVALAGLRWARQAWLQRFEPYLLGFVRVD
jgi:hypothetical protein